MAKLKNKGSVASTAQTSSDALKSVARDKMQAAVAVLVQVIIDAGDSVRPR